jgi:phosphatidylglycerol lysyltransferase
MAMSPSAVFDLVLSRGRDAMSFLALESGMRHWLDETPPGGTGACVAYVETRGAWVAACGPLVDDAESARAASRFVAAARQQGRRACFFATESLEAPSMTRVLLGEQPVFRPAEWLRELPKHRSLREQLRRARAKGVRVRRVDGPELEQDALLRTAVERLASAWLRARHLEPMGFLVSVEPFHHPHEHRYFVAELQGDVVGFLSAVPIGRRGWLVEDVFRARQAPNGTTEALVHALMSEVADSEQVTLGLTPLAGDVAWPLRIARWLTRPLFDFEGLRAFRERMHPHAWQPVWLVHPQSQLTAVSLVDALRAFARGSLLTFAARSFFRHPSGLPWALAVPLPAWTAALAWLVVAHRASLLGFPSGELGLWVAFDALLLLVLVGVAMRPRRSRLVLATSLAAFDAALSLGHLVWIGPGATLLQASLRTTATVAPFVGAALLAWATTQTTG